MCDSNVNQCSFFVYRSHSGEPCNPGCWVAETGIRLWRREAASHKGEESTALRFNIKSQTTCLKSSLYPQATRLLNPGLTTALYHTLTIYSYSVHIEISLFYWNHAIVMSPYCTTNVLYICPYNSMMQLHCNYPTHYAHGQTKLLYPDRISLLILFPFSCVPLVLDLVYLVVFISMLYIYVTYLIAFLCYLFDYYVTIREACKSMTITFDLTGFDLS
jgi:hypothetical protein